MSNHAEDTVVRQLQETVAALREKNARIREQEIRGVWVTFDQMLSKELREKLNIHSEQNFHVAMVRLTWLLSELEEENARLREQLGEAHGSGLRLTSDLLRAEEKNVTLRRELVALQDRLRWITSEEREQWQRAERADELAKGEA